MEIPEWQYPLYKESDKRTYAILEKAGRSGNYPRIEGRRDEIARFLKVLIASQKMKDYRKFRDMLLDGIAEGKDGCWQNGKGRGEA